MGKNLKNKIKKLFIEKLPNTLLTEHIKVEFPDLTSEQINEVLEQLIKEDFLEEKTYLNTPYNRKGYNLKGDFSNYPIIFETDLGSISIPRMIDRDVARGEDINSIAIGLSRAFDHKISEMKKTFDTEIKKYWASVATVFGLFVSLFSIINFAVKPIYFSSQLNLSAEQQFIQTLYNLGPLAGVLLIFILALWLILKR